MDEIQLMIKRGDTGGLTPLPKLPKTTKVKQIFEMVKETLKIASSFSLIYGSTNLQDCQEKTLLDCKIQDKATIIVVFRLAGGPGPMQLARAMMQQKTGLQPLRGYVTLSTEECMILMIEPDEGQYHAKMPCGHVISPQALTTQALSIVQEGRYQFYCPYAFASGKICGTPWPFFVVKHVGCFTKEENEEIESKLAENYMEKAMGMQRCPGCMNYCIRENPQNPRVCCAVCKASGNSSKASYRDYCWYCNQSWKGGLGKRCGNNDCDGNDGRVKYLKTCPEITINGVKCPSVRACPKCGVLINHISGCNNMTCKISDKEHKFCFICLKEGMCNGGCKPAAVQTFQ